MLKTASQIIDALGGTQKVAEICGVGASAISNYRQNGFPAKQHYVLAKACEDASLTIDAQVFGGISRASQAEHQADPLQSKKRHFRDSTAPMPESDGMLASFEKAGFTPIYTPILQPSAPFINLMGAEMQRRLYRFTDPGGEELCLRPDLTIPIALKYLQEKRQGEARFCYQGTAFRYQPRGAGKPEEFTQLGIEIIGGKTGDKAEQDDSEVLIRLRMMIEAAGVKDFEMKFADSRVSSGVFWLSLSDFIREKGIDDVTAQEIKDIKKRVTTPAEFITLVTSAPMEKTSNISLSIDEESMIAGRSGAEIMARLEKKNNQTKPLKIDPKTRKNLLNYLSDADDSPFKQKEKEAILELNKQTQQKIRDTVAQIGNHDTGYNLPITFSHTSKMAYYTGISFEIHAPILGSRRVIASGGRYNDLLQTLGADKSIPAVGGVIFVERMQEAIQQQKGAS